MMTNMTYMTTMVTKMTKMTTYDEPLTLRLVQATRGNLSQSRRRRPPARLSLEMGRFLQLRIEFKLVIDIKDI